MILVELEIEDYKQFAGMHRFAPTPHGVVAVIGPNGAGKTTLFEAIEWCLFQPSNIKNDEVPTRGASTRPRVKLTLHDPRSGDAYVVERRLRNNVASADVWRGDGQDRVPLANGSRPVTGYVWKHLIGLDHKAFVSTFFTRQKELHFFSGSNMGPSDRRREVQRLLGLETIRKAQELIAEERRQAGALAEGARAQVQETIASRNFEVELTETGKVIAARQAALTASEKDVQTAVEAEQQCEAGLTRVLELKHQDEQHGTRSAGLRAQITDTERTLAAAQNELARLNALQEERKGVAALAETSEERSAAVAVLEVERARHESRSKQRSLAKQAGQSIDAQVHAAQQAVERSRTALLPTWQWSINGLAPEDVLSELAGVAATLDVAGSRASLQAMERLARAETELRDAQKTHTRFLSRTKQLEEEREALMCDGDPADMIAALDRRIADLTAQVGQDQGTVQLLRQQRDQLREMSKRLAAFDLSQPCPTCARPFSEHEAAEASRHTEEQEREAEAQIATLDERIASSMARVASDKRDRAEQDARRVALEKCVASLDAAAEHIARQAEEVERREDELQALLVKAGRTAAPSNDDIAAEGARLTALDAVEKAAVSLERVRDTIVEQRRLHATAVAAMEQIGDVHFEQSALDATRAALDEATRASSRLGEIDRQLERRPERETEQRDASERLAALTAQLGEVEQERHALGYSTELLEDAQDARFEAGQKVDNLRKQVETAQEELRTARSARDGVMRDEQLYKEAAARAEAKEREHDVLDQMAKEFNAFDRFVSQRVRPQLEDLTSELVRIVTDDKYSSITMDDDYGVLITDGEIDRFPLTQFSGGERDVVALCARLALSRIIGAQAINPPRFLVLDEVFGSLDRERRQNLLEMLSNLAGSADVFQQLFVISHVDDVRASPAFSEIWRVVEESDGTSSLENINLTGTAEEL